MRKKDYTFRFKQFLVSHSRSSIHVGVDGVLIGAWTPFPDSGLILDVGTGCGVISLMAAQKSADARILALDVDIPSIEEASLNFSQSPWSNRLTAVIEDFSSFCQQTPLRFDVIVSNPPFFASGADASLSSRMRARHQGSLSPFSLVEQGRKILSPSGIISMILPTEFDDELNSVVADAGLIVRRKTIVRGNPSVASKRILVEIGNVPEGADSDTAVNELIIEHSLGNFTDNYKSLCKDFYLHF